MSPARAQPATPELRALREAAGALDVDLTHAQAVALLRLLDELSVWNRTYNLTAITQRAAMVKAHLLDSLSALPELSGRRIADVGTGAGFPGLPLAVLSPQRAFTLIDSVGKKIRFVTHAARALELDNVSALQARVETLRPSTPFDSVVARACAPLPVLLSSVRGLCGPTTRVLAMQGRLPREELAQLPRGWRVELARQVHIPGLVAERHILRVVPSAPAARLNGS